jgi:hypothetical protein
MEWLSQIGPLERLGHCAIEVGDEVQHFGAQIGGGGEIPAPQELADQDTEPKFDQVNAKAID